jgi:hypothetical protein
MVHNFKNDLKKWGQIYFYKQRVEGVGKLIRDKDKG